MDTALSHLLDQQQMTQPPVFLVRWFKPWFIVQFEELLQQVESNETIILNAREVNRDSFRSKLEDTINSEEAHSNTVLLIQGFESYVTEIARSLNGYRETLFTFRAVYILLRDDLTSQFIREAPDLLAVIRGNIIRAEDYAPPLGEEEIRQILKKYEKKYKQTSSDFYNHFKEDPTTVEIDYQQWAEACDIAEWMGMTL